ncbi:hypothetical protein IFM89_003361 [Coptis chinensis]|uniref:WIT1/2 N-terminal helical bundle domain-containing protein n=1 Tax=Coptis chinensis TaxID=261450 RepID=A0A835ITX1_9MAGN|nr:hypothetical protein IFM89_003361 [Coptis chinensis]
MAMVMLSAANDDIKIGEPDALPDNICLNELLTHVELDVAYCSEKLLNFENLLLQVFSRENEYESLLATENNVILEESVDKGLEFDFLYGILDSELRELDNFMGSMQTEIADARQKNSFVETIKKLLMRLKKNCGILKKL